jgi:hypothetical protein
MAVIILIIIIMIIIILKTNGHYKHFGKELQKTAVLETTHVLKI